MLLGLTQSLIPEIKRLFDFRSSLCLFVCIEIDPYYKDCLQILQKYRLTLRTLFYLFLFNQILPNHKNDANGCGNLSMGILHSR